MAGSPNKRVFLGALAASALYFATMPAAAAELTFDLRVTGGRVPETMRLVRVTQGDLVRLRWSADRPLALHLHGYDVEQSVTPNGTATMTFTARVAGRFPIYIVIPDRRGGHSHEEQALVVIEVQPR